MDIALAVEQIYPDADFRKCRTYAELWNSWEDKRSIPSQTQLAEAWLTCLLNRELAAGVEELQAAQRALLSDKIEREKLSTAEQISLLFDVVATIPPGLE